MGKRKLVLEEQEGSVVIGFQQEGCDPVLKVHQGNLQSALEAIPQVLAEAQAKWELSPRNPAYKPPVEPKPIAPAAKKADALPLLAETEKATPVTAEVPAEVKAEVKAEAPAEGKVVVEAGKVGPVSVAPAAAEAKPAEPAPPAKPATGQWEYWLKDGRGPYPDVQAAMDAMGMDKESRPHHHRWDRLSTQLKEQIQRQPKK